MSQALPDGPTGWLIRCDKVLRKYADGDVTALKEVDLTIARGEYIAIMGPSGSGKSTLLNLLGGLDRPSSGVVYFEDVPLTNQAHFDRIRIDKVGIVFQSFHLLPTLTARENVQIPMFEMPVSARNRVRKADELLKLVGLSHRANHLPSRLSGGERQRVCIARALANSPPLLLADEPTGNLDSITGEEVLRLFEDLHRERQMTLIVVTHSQEVAERADRLIRMRDGKIVADQKRRVETAPVTDIAVGR
jgi:putative ABC transport system ATP-binding protein